MNRFDAAELTNAMTEAASMKVECWSAIRLVAERELLRFARTLEDVRELYAAGVIEEDEAYRMASIHRHAALMVLRNTDCVGAATARRAAPRVMRAAVEAVYPLVNSIIGFPLMVGPQ
jgi:hypothetical protein